MVGVVYDVLIAYTTLTLRKADGTQTIPNTEVSMSHSTLQIQYTFRMLVLFLHQHRREIGERVPHILSHAYQRLREVPEGKIGFTMDDLTIILDGKTEAAERFQQAVANDSLYTATGLGAWLGMGISVIGLLQIRHDQLPDDCKLPRDFNLARFAAAVAQQMRDRGVVWDDSWLALTPMSG